MSLSQEALQKVRAKPTGSKQRRRADFVPQLYGEIQTQALKTQQELALGRSQLVSKQREMRLTQLTLNEMSSLAPETPIYEGVGKM